MAITRSEVARPGAPWQDWARFSATLLSADGVHTPSPFSAVLASSLPDLSGDRVIDVGSGSGLLTLAAFASGAAQVTAVDMDPAALQVTQDNVRAAFPDADLVLRELDFRDLGSVSAEVALTNPPQRPSRILAAVEPDQRHLHEGGGEDGLDTLRIVMRSVRTSTLLSTAADVLPVDSLDLETWDELTQIASAQVPMHDAWRQLATTGRVNVWKFSRRSDWHRAPAL